MVLRFFVGPAIPRDAARSGFGLGRPPSFASVTRDAAPVAGDPRWTPGAAKRIAGRVAQAAEYLHGKGLMHGAAGPHFWERCPCFGSLWFHSFKDGFCRAWCVKHGNDMGEGVWRLGCFYQARVAFPRLSGARHRLLRPLNQSIPNKPFFGHSKPGWVSGCFVLLGRCLWGRLVRVVCSQQCFNLVADIWAETWWYVVGSDATCSPGLSPGFLDMHTIGFSMNAFWEIG